MPPVVWIIIDGLRPDALAQANPPHLAALQAEGAHTLRATSVMPCITLPCHMSMFHSVPPGRHGVTTNDWSPMARPLPGLADQARAAGLRPAFFYNWEPLRNLSRPGSLSFAFFHEHNGVDPHGDTVIADAAIAHLAHHRPDLSFVYFGVLDNVGHTYGWMSDPYLAYLAHVDQLVGALRAALPPGYTLLVGSDHGGHDRSHGQDIPEDMTVPWMAAGPGIRAGYAIPRPVSLLDTAPTLARVLGIPAHPEWEGSCLDEIFR